MPHTALRYAQSHYFYPLFLSIKLSCNFFRPLFPLLFKCFLCRHLWHGTLSVTKTVLKYFTWHSHTQRKFHLRVGTTICTGTHSKIVLFQFSIKITLKKINKNIYSSQLFTLNTATNTGTQAQGKTYYKNFSMNFIHYIQYYTLLHIVVYSRHKHYIQWYFSGSALRGA